MKRSESYSAMNSNLLARPVPENPKVAEDRVAPKAETLATVTNLVEQSVVKAMEEYQSRLANLAPGITINNTNTNTNVVGPQTRTVAKESPIVINNHNNNNNSVGGNPCPTCPPNRSGGRVNRGTIGGTIINH